MHESYRRCALLLPANFPTREAVSVVEKRKSFSLFFFFSRRRSNLEKKKKTKCETFCGLLSAAAASPDKGSSVNLSAKDAASIRLPSAITATTTMLQQQEAAWTPRCGGGGITSEEEEEGHLVVVVVGV